MRKQIFLLVLLLANALWLFGLNEERLLEEGKQYYGLDNYRDAIYCLSAGIESNIKPVSEYYYWLGKSYLAMQKYDEALNYFEAFLDMNFEPGFEDAEDIVYVLKNEKNLPEYLQMLHIQRTLPGYINGKYADYAPYVIDDGKTMYFASTRKTVGANKENIWKAEKISGIWGKPKLVKEISSDNNEALGSISVDGKTAYLFGNYSEYSKTGDLYTSNFDGRKWQEPELIPGINTTSPEFQPFVFEDRIMIFSAIKEDGFGGSDLYVTEKLGQSWTKPVNLGEMINTDKDEQTAFIDYDGRTLYFASKGHKGIGGFDIFKTMRTGSNWTEWVEPVNLGVRVNSVKDDRYYFHRKDSNEAYLSSNRARGFGSEDIILFNISRIKTPEIKLDKNTISGVVSDEEGNPVSAEIIWSYFLDGIEMSETAISNDKGQYSIKLGLSESYNFSITKEGFFLKIGQLEVTDNFFEYDIVLTALEPEKSYVIENIYFEFDKAKLLPSSFAELDNLALTLLENDKLKVEINGFTDNVGSEKYNQKLSFRRANSVVKYLVEKGVINDNITPFGYGENNPVDTNKTHEGRARNRRVEMKIIKDDEDKDENLIEKAESELQTEMPEVLVKYLSSGIKEIFENNNDNEEMHGEIQINMVIEDSGIITAVKIKVLEGEFTDKFINESSDYLLNWKIKAKTSADYVFTLKF